MVAGWPAEGEAARERRRPGRAGHPVGGGRRRGRGEGGDDGRAARRRAWLAAVAVEGSGDGAGAGDGGGVAPEEEIAEELKGHALSGRNAVEQGVA